MRYWNVNVRPHPNHIYPIPSLPMRYWNRGECWRLYSGCNIPSLPMRYWNAPWGRVYYNWLSFPAYLWGIEIVDHFQKFSISIIIPSLPMRYWNQGTIVWDVPKLPFPAYLWGIEIEISPPPHCVDWSGFPAYLWGIEMWMSGHILTTLIPFPAYLWGIEIMPPGILSQFFLNSQPTYEVLKSPSLRDKSFFLLYSQPTYEVLKCEYQATFLQHWFLIPSLPMRYWNMIRVGAGRGNQFNSQPTYEVLKSQYPSRE